MITELRLEDYAIPDSDDINQDMEEFGFYVKHGRYFTDEIKGKKKVSVELSNFVMRSVFHLLNGTNNSQRILYLQRYTRGPGDMHLVEVFSNEMKPESFETILKSRRCTFFGQPYFLKKIFARIMDEEHEAIILPHIGWYPEYRIYAFADAIFNGSLHKTDRMGIVSDKGRQFYLPAFGFANLHKEDWKTERLYRFCPGNIDFKSWSGLLYTAYGSNGIIGIAYTLLAVYRDIVFSQTGFFPYLFLFGDAGTGKTSFTENLLALFGQDIIGTPLNNATTVALSRLVSSRCNSLFYFKEYTSETDESAEDFILTAYDGAGRTTGIKSNDNKTKSYPVRSAMIFDGNHLPSQKSAILSRMILLNFETTRFSEEESRAFNKLKHYSEEGLGNVLLNILEHRDFLEKNFRETFLRASADLKSANNSQLPERTVNHLALLYTMVELLGQRFIFPVSVSDFKSILLDNGIAQNDLLKESSVLHVFWQAFSFNVKKGLLIEHTDQFQDKAKTHFRLKSHSDGMNEITILQLKLSMCYPAYVKYCKENNLRFLDQSSLRMILTAKTNTTYIPNTQKGRNIAYRDRNFGLCHQFLINTVTNGFEINEVEIETATHVGIPRQ